MIRALLLILLPALPLFGQAPTPAPPRWRGFNLLEMFRKEEAKPFREDDFRTIAEWGFNFARLPMDYRIWIQDGDWRTIDPGSLRNVDAALEYGKKYGVHVSLNFHRGPGYCVNPPKEAKDLWTDADAREVFALHWGAFAKRYKGIPSERLSFDLLNEPAGVEAAAYVAAMTPAIEAIRREDPERRILAEGLKWGNAPVPELLPLKVDFSTRGYAPMGISHYAASWIPDSAKMPFPTWPVRQGVGDHLYGVGQPELHAPLVFKDFFAADTPFSIRVNTVSQKTRLLVLAGDKVVLDKPFEPGPGEGEWKKAVFVEQYKVWQNVYDRDYTATIPAGTTEVRLVAIEGDWLTFSRLKLGSLEIVPGDLEWGRKPGTFTIGPDGRLDLSTSPILYDHATHQKEQIAPWKVLEAKGAAVHVGEWGVLNRTPHPVALAWMEDCLRNWKDAGWGWALWELRGGFGVLDSNRSDVTYEEFRGHKLDRKMLDLLRAY
ncbi:MAG TPA: cellulase family glycosylhydrolase [Planctomycetota bacterium]|nr:cellulase family glycosylhydrolase [Planctomycetota bacterium]